MGCFLFPAVMNTRNQGQLAGKMNEMVRKVAGTRLRWLFLLVGSNWTVVKDLKVAGNNTKKKMVYLPRTRRTADEVLSRSRRPKRPVNSITGGRSSQQQP